MKIGIIGAGAFGLALSSVISDNNYDISLWTNSDEHRNKLLNDRSSDIFPNYILGNNITVVNSLKDCVVNKDLVILVVPVAYIRNICIRIKEYINDDINICIASKGIERGTGLFPYEIVKDILKTENIAVLSGPSFALDIINKRPIGFSLASFNNDLCDICVKVFSNNYIKVRCNNDVIGTEICGAIKNVIAIAAGILDGLGVGHSTRAMYITESLHDIQEIINAFDGDKKTVLSFAGFGDLLLTCTSTNSRNYYYGKLIGEGKNSKELEDYLTNTTVEGYYTLESIWELLKNKKVEIPIINLIYDIINNNAKVEDLLNFLVVKE